MSKRSKDLKVLIANSKLMPPTSIKETTIKQTIYINDLFSKSCINHDLLYRASFLPDLGSMSKLKIDFMH